MGKSFHPLSVFRGPDALKQILVSWENAYFGTNLYNFQRTHCAKNKQTKKLFVKKSPASSVLSPESFAAFLYQGCL